MQTISDEKEFLEIINQSQKYILISFSASWCGPCVRSDPIFSTYKEKFPDSIDFYKVDLDQGEEVAVMCQVESLPFYVMYKDSKEIWRFKGMINEGFEEQIQEHLDSVRVDISPESSETT